MTRTRADALEILRGVFAADYGCYESAFLSEGVVISSAPSRDGGRRYGRAERAVRIGTMGASAVVQCHPDQVDWAQANLSHMSRDDLFSPSTCALLTRYVEADAMTLQGPVPIYVCPEEDLRVSRPPPGVSVDVVSTAAAVLELYRYEGFTHALGYRLDNPVPDMLATVATDSGTVVGIAGASADSEGMWQIGIDVAAPARSSGIGRALVSRLSRAVLDAGRLPYYAHAIPNVISGALAVSVGYRHAAVEMYSRNRP